MHYYFKHVIHFVKLKNGIVEARKLCNVKTIHSVMQDKKSSKSEKYGIFLFIKKNIKLLI